MLSVTDNTTMSAISCNISQPRRYSQYTAASYSYSSTEVEKHLTQENWIAYWNSTHLSKHQ